MIEFGIMKKEEFRMMTWQGGGGIPFHWEQNGAGGRDVQLNYRPSAQEPGLDWEM